jgi:stress-induced-phosphoprotein 1
MLVIQPIHGSAAQYEAADYDAAIKTEEEAVEQGRELRADYKLIAKWVNDC